MTSTVSFKDKLKQIFFTVYSNGDIVDYHKLFIHS